jgi:adenylate kinase
MKPEQQVKLREAVFRRISRLRGNYIIDTHFVVGSEGRYVQGLPYSVIRLLKNVGGLICIDAPTKEIIGRQVSDKSRKREIEEEMFVDAERTMNMSVSSYLSWYLDVPMYFIENRNGRLEESVRTFKNAVSALING